MKNWSLKAPNLSAMKATCYNGLPEPLWDDIFLSVGVDERYLRQLSTMSKQFLSVSNRLKRTLHITTTNNHRLPRLLQRFPNIKNINLPFFIDPARFFGEIDRFGISLESLDMSLTSAFPIKHLRELPLSALRSTLRSLKLGYVEDQSDVDGDLEIIAELFPNLEVLELCWGYEVTDYGVAMFSSKLKKLRRVSFSGNVSITDASIRSLVENCVDLEEIALDQCRSVTREGISFAFRHCRNLESLVLQKMYVIESSDPLALARNLSSLEFCSVSVSDDLFRTITRANIPLRRFSLSRIGSFPCHGILLLLEAYHSLLEYFAIENLTSKDRLKGHDVIRFAPYLWNVRTVKLNYCCQLSTKELLMLVNVCRSLTALETKDAQISKDQNLYSLFGDRNFRKYQLKSLNLSFNEMLTDQCLAAISRTCPYLSQLIVSGCKTITHKGVSEIMRYCPDLRTMEMNGCEDVATLESDSRVSKLEVVEARGSSLDDKSLNLIALKCPELMCLDASNCSSITAIGVREVVMNCKNLCKLGVSFKRIGPDLEYWIRSKKPWLVNRYV